MFAEFNEKKIKNDIQRLSRITVALKIRRDRDSDFRHT